MMVTTAVKTSLKNEFAFFQFNRIYFDALNMSNAGDLFLELNS